MNVPLDDRLRETLTSVGRDRDARVVVLTGAGVSAESGIPTFRGDDGYWTIGSAHYTPQEMATVATFSAHPDAVWQWYLYRRTICRDARPNAGHAALERLERALGERFLLITQNVDGLHRRAGNSAARTFEIHGNIDTMRCAAGCTTTCRPLPDGIGAFDRDTPLDRDTIALLACPACGGRARPHVLWFDECYDEAWFRFESSMAAAADANLLITAGTSGATTLPMHIGRLAAQRGIPMIDVNPATNPFGELAESAGGFFCAGPAATWLPALADALIDASNG